jgi:hypothetical protein
MARITAVDEQYRATANAVGLMQANTSEADERVLLESAADEELREIEASSEESAEFLQRNPRAKTGVLRGRVVIVTHEGDPIRRLSCADDPQQKGGIINRRYCL